MSDAKNSEAPGSRILVVDDEEENIRVVAGVLAPLGYELSAAFSATEAAERVASVSPDLILLDIGLPDKSGVDLCAEWRATPSLAEVPVVFLSAANDKKLIVRALESGGVDYITKPFDRAELLSRVRAHIALKRTRDELADLLADREALIGMLAHDFKSHLSGTLMSTELLAGRTNEMTERSAELVTAIAESTERMHLAVSQFLANQRALALEPQLSPVSPRPILATLVADWNQRADAKGITFHSDLPPDLPSIHADKEALRQILDNLLSNAVKFTPSGGSVEVSAETLPSGGCQITIRDSGPGFTEEDRANAFRRYTKLSAKPTGQESSSGLGLFIVNKLAAAMDAELLLESIPGKGATFKVVFSS